MSLCLKIKKLLVNLWMFRQNIATRKLCYMVKKPNHCFFFFCCRPELEQEVSVLTLLRREKSVLLLLGGTRFLCGLSRFFLHLYNCI